MRSFKSAAALRVPLLAAACLCVIGQAAIAQTIPAPWSATAVGASAVSGSAVYSSGVFSIDAAGGDITETSDQFQFLYQAVTGDVQIIARVDSLTAVNSFTNAGVMIRSSLAPDSPHAYAAVTASKGVRFRSRVSSGANTSHVTGPRLAPPSWLRVVRQGSRLTGYSSTNGITWTSIGSATIAIGSTAYVGVAVASHDATASTTARASNVTITSLGLPAGQQSTDIGAPTLNGYAFSASASYTIGAGGSGIGATKDEFHFVYQPVTGNVDVIARVASLGTDRWSKAGVTIRESLTGESRHATAATSVRKGDVFQRRLEPGGDSVSTSGGSATAPAWLRLVRSGDTFEASRSADGITWTTMGSETIPMQETVYVGLLATSHNAAVATTVAVDNVRLIAAAEPDNRSPSVSLTSPATGTEVTAPTTVTISALASDPENRLLSVDFYADTTLILRDTSAPYSVEWPVATQGTYAVTAVAHDADGGSTTSSAVSVTALAPINEPPQVTLSTSDVLLTAPATITLTATAFDAEGQMARVEFFAGTTWLGTDTTAPYSFAWSGVAAGSYSFTAVAFDAGGASAASAPLLVTVNPAATTPLRWVAFTASSDHATNVTSYVLKVFAPEANPSTTPPLASSDLGMPTPASDGAVMVDREPFFTGLLPGDYVATVTAIGPGGQTSSAIAAFTR